MEIFTCFSVSIEDAIASIHFSRPELHNRFDEPLHREFPRVLADLASLKEDIAALVISADGRSFSAGGDMEMMLRANRSLPMRERLAYEGAAIIENLLALPFPVIAALQGPAVGLGASIVGCCDIVVACRSARIADPHVALGLVAGDGGIIAWSQSVGIMRAKRYLLTGDFVDAETAFKMGLVTDLVETPEDVVPAARTIAARVAALPRRGVRGTKRAFSRLTRDLYGSAFELSFAYEMQTLAGAELRETVEAMIAARQVRSGEKK